MAYAVIRTDKVFPKYTGLFWQVCLFTQLTFVFPDGMLSLEDLRGFLVRVSDAWTVKIGEYTMHFPPPPAGGAILSFILQLMHGRSRSLKKNCASYTESLINLLVNITPPFVFLRVWAFFSLQPRGPENLDFASVP